MEIIKFKEKRFTNILFEEGMVRFPLLEESEIIELKNLFGKYHSEQPEGFYATTHSNDKSFRKEMSDAIMTIVADKIEPSFENIKVLGGAFISKAPGEKGILPLHQDWNIVDENSARSYNLWVPLVNVNEQNGAMRILKNSHMKHETYRGPNLPPILYQISDVVDNNMVSVNMKAGEGLLYDHALWHSSPTNNTKELRIAIVLGVVPKGVDLKFYYKNEDVIEEYESNTEFFFTNDPKEGPKGLTLKRSIPFDFKMLSEDEFNETYLGIERQKKKSIWSFFKRK